MLRRAARLTVAQGGVILLRAQFAGAGDRQDRRDRGARIERGRKRARRYRKAARDACRGGEPALSRHRLGAAAALERERKVLREQARASGKSEDIIERMVDGRLRKFYEEVVLLEQIFVVDQETTDIEGGRKRRQDSRRADQDHRLARFALGEGIERPRTDFAAEVASQLEH